MEWERKWGNLWRYLGSLTYLNGSSLQNQFTNLKIGSAKNVSKRRAFRGTFMSPVELLYHPKHLIRRVRLLWAPWSSTCWFGLFFVPPAVYKGNRYPHPALSHSSFPLPSSLSGFSPVPPYSWKIIQNIGGGFQNSGMRDKIGKIGMQVVKKDAWGVFESFQWKIRTNRSIWTNFIRDDVTRYAFQSNFNYVLGNENCAQWWTQPI